MGDFMKKNKNNIIFQKGDILEIISIANWEEKKVIEILVNKSVSADFLLENLSIKSIRVGFEIFLPENILGEI